MRTWWPTDGSEWRMLTAGIRYNTAHHAVKLFSGGIAGTVDAGQPSPAWSQKSARAALPLTSGSLGPPRRLGAKDSLGARTAPHPTAQR